MNLRILELSTHLSIFADSLTIIEESIGVAFPKQKINAILYNRVFFALFGFTCGKISVN